MHRSYLWHVGGSLSAMEEPATSTSDTTSVSVSPRATIAWHGHLHYTEERWWWCWALTSSWSLVLSLTGRGCTVAQPSLQQTESVLSCELRPAVAYSVRWRALCSHWSAPTHLRPRTTRGGETRQPSLLPRHTPLAQKLGHSVRVLGGLRTVIIKHYK